MSRFRVDHGKPVPVQAGDLMALFGPRAYGVARRMQRRNFRKADRARYWAAVAREIRHARMAERGKAGA